MSGGATRTTSLRSVRYYPDKAMLAIEFHSGGTIEFYDVPACVYEGLVASAAQERYVETYIRPKFRHRRILRV
ncbi:MAG TPA: KTSC domain-containing protein [Selenomonadales bacterium]|nr:KTSC domain-containing protein [Selenomonadales bacterium]